MSKPVVWMSPDGKVSNTEGKLFYIPLYTHPAELTDEEIEKIIFQHNQLYQDGTYDCKNENLIWFAKAILRKAQEK